MILKVSAKGILSTERYNKKESLKQLQKAVGGYIERIYNPYLESKNIDIYCNDEGLVHDLKQNHVASVIAGQLICGDCVVIGHDGHGGSIGLNREQAIAFVRYAAKCLEEFKAYVERRDKK